LRLRTGPVPPPAWAPPRVDANTIVVPSGPQTGSKLWILIPLTSGCAGVTRRQPLPSTFTVQTPSGSAAPARAAKAIVVPS
jgi:hypothetical protein